MLTGWELYFEPGPFGLADREIRDVGIWIDHWTYSPGPSGGTLTYTLGSVLDDKDYAPDFKERHRVTILGIGPLAGGGGVLKKGSAQ